MTPYFRIAKLPQCTIFFMIWWLCNFRSECSLKTFPKNVFIHSIVRSWGFRHLLRKIRWRSPTISHLFVTFMKVSSVDGFWMIESNDTMIQIRLVLVCASHAYLQLVVFAMAELILMRCLELIFPEIWLNFEKMT